MMNSPAYSEGDREQCVGRTGENGREKESEREKEIGSKDKERVRKKSRYYW